MLKILGYKPKIDVLKGRKGAGVGGKGTSGAIVRGTVGADRETHTMVSEIEIGAEEREDVENALIELAKVFPALNKEVDRVKTMIELAEEGVEGLNKVETKEKLKLTEVSQALNNILARDTGRNRAATMITEVESEEEVRGKVKGLVMGQK